MDNLQIPRVFTELMAALDPSISIQEVNLQYGERKIDIKIKTIDENGNEKSSPNNTGGIFTKILAYDHADFYPTRVYDTKECQAALKKIFDNGRHIYIKQDDIRITIED